MKPACSLLTTLSLYNSLSIQMMKSESRSEVIREYTSFKKDVLYCLLTNDGLGLLESGIFQRF